MSDREIGKKMIEELHLELFLDAYENATGRSLELVDGGESPDFVVRRPSGSYAGLELVQVYRDSPADWIPDSDLDWRRGGDTAFAVTETIGWKAEKLSRPHWRYRKQTILVATLMDVPMEEVAPHFDPSLQSEFASHGFVEIWLADLTPDDLDAYSGDIRLFGLHPKKWWGLHERRNPFRKPYG